jgi:hypothetical protein
LKFSSIISIEWKQRNKLGSTNNSCYWRSCWRCWCRHSIRVDFRLCFWCVCILWSPRRACRWMATPCRILWVTKTREQLYLLLTSMMWWILLELGRIDRLSFYYPSLTCKYRFNCICRV